MRLVALSSLFDWERLSAHSFYYYNEHEVKLIVKKVHESNEAHLSRKEDVLMTLVI